MDEVKCSLKEYYDALRQTTEQGLSERSAVPIPSVIIKLSLEYDNILSAIEEILHKGPREPLYEYAVVKLFWEQFGQNASEPIRNELHRKLLDIAWYIGEYSEAKILAEAWLSHYTPANDIELASQNLRVLNRKAKALRNLGKFDEAFNTYREALVLCDEYSLDVEKAFAWIMIGKMYGNYQNQNSIFTYFIYQALDLLNELKSQTSDEFQEYEIQRYIAICYDSLGQTYGESETGWKQALEYFRAAMDINKRIANQNGLSRNWCHLAMLVAKWDKEAELKEILEIFQRGFRLLVRDPAQKRGRGIRTIQLGELLWRYGSYERAGEFVKRGSEISLDFRDYRTFVRACIVQADLQMSEKSETARKILEEALQYAKKYRLSQYELEINRRLGDLCSMSPYPSHIFQSVMYFQKNREILLNFRDKVIENQAHIAYQKNMDEEDEIFIPEFRDLSDEQRIHLYDGLLRDYDQIIEQLNLNVQTILAILQPVLDALEHGRDVSLIGLSGALVRALRHDVKHLLPRREGGDRWERILCDTDNCFAMLQKIREENPKEASIQQALVLLSHLKDEINQLTVQFRDFEHLLSGRLRRPAGDSLINSLRESCLDAIKRLTEQERIKSEQVETDFAIDVRLPCERDWLTRAIVNLLRNGIEACIEHGYNTNSFPLLRISLSKENIGDTEVGNPSHIVVLDIANRGKPGDAERVKRALQQPGWFDKEGGSGVGIDFASLIFVTICRAEADAFESEGYTHVVFRFQPDGMRIRTLELAGMEEGKY